MTYDVAIVGAGPGGYVAAIRCQQLGLKTILIEKEELGGVCLNWGCIPTKALLKSAELYHTLHTQAHDFGLRVESVDFNWTAMFEHSRAVSKQLRQGVQGLLRKNKVEVLYGRGELLTPNEILIKTSQDEKTITAKNVIIATGGRARSLALIPSHGRIWTSKEALNPPFKPESVLIIGSGAIGIEFASFYNALNIKTHVVEMLDRILPQEDHDISKTALTSFKEQGIVFSLSSTIVKITPHDLFVDVMIADANGIVEAYSFDVVLLAIGIVGNVENLGLEQIGVNVEKGHIVVDEYCRTTVPSIYAIGDVASPPWLAHKASHEGILCAEAISGLPPHKLDPLAIAACTYSMPQIASVGWTEQKALDAGRKIRVGNFPFRANGKALASSKTQGFIKTIFDEETGELLGAHMIGADVSELIHGFAIAKTLEATEEELIQTVFPHPTLSEAMHESTLDAFKRAIHF